MFYLPYWPILNHFCDGQSLIVAQKTHTSLEHEQLPKLARMIASARDMIFRQLRKRGRVEPSGVEQPLAARGRTRRLFQLAAEPLRDGQDEALLGPVKDLPGQRALHRLLERELALPSGNPPRLGQACGQFDQVMVEQRLTRPPEYA